MKTGWYANTLPPVRDRRIAQHPLLWLSAVLFSVNIAVAWKLFHTEYISETGTVEGVFIAYARYARDHWPDLEWCRIWYGGLPFANAYPPGLHLTVAAVSAAAHISAASAFHFVVALLYSLGPVTLFWMTFRLTRSASWSFSAGMLYSLVSPSAFLIGDIRRDLELIAAQRLHTLVGYADSPHVASLTLIPLAILALDLALEKRRPIYYVAAALALASVPLTNWPGAIVLAFAVISSHGLSLDCGERLRGWAVILAISALGYAFAIPWAPPSTVLTTLADTQKFEQVNEFAPRHLRTRRLCRSPPLSCCGPFPSRAPPNTCASLFCSPPTWPPSPWAIIGWASPYWRSLIDSTWPWRWASS